MATNYKKLGASLKGQSVSNIVSAVNKASGGGSSSTPASSQTRSQIEANPLVFDTPAYAKQFGQTTPTTSSVSRRNLESAISNYSSANPDTQALANMFSQYIKENPTIGAQDLTKSNFTVPNLPTKETTPNYDSTIQANNIALGLNADGTPKVTTTETQPESVADSLKQIGIEPPPAPESAASDYLKAQKTFEIKQKQDLVNSLTNTLNAIVAKSQADQLAVTGQGRGIPESIIGGQQAQISKEAAIQALPIQAQLSAAQGNLDLANKNLDTYYNILATDRTNQYNYKMKLYDYAYDRVNKAEQRIIDEKRIKEGYAHDEYMANLNNNLAIKRENAKTIADNTPLSVSEINQYQIDYPEANIKIGDTKSSIQAKINPVIDTSKITFDGLTAQLPNGSKYTFANQQELDNFKKNNNLNQNTQGISVPSQTSSKINNDIANIQASSYIKNLPKNIDVKQTIKDILLQKGYSYKEISDSSIGSSLDSFMVSASSNLKKLFGE